MLCYAPFSRGSPPSPSRATRQAFPITGCGEICSAFSARASSVCSITGPCPIHAANPRLKYVYPRFKGSWPGERIFYSSRVQAYSVTILSAMIDPLRKLAEGVPHGGHDSPEQSRGPFTVGARGGPQAQYRYAHRYLLSSASGSRPVVWSWSGGLAPGHSRWSSCSL